MNDNMKALTLKDLRQTKEVFDKNQTPEDKREINIEDGAGRWKLKLHEAENYIKHNRTDR